MGTPCVRLFGTEFHPQWLRNAPVEPCARILTCGAHPWSRRPRLAARARASNPSGRHSSPPSTSNPIGGRKAQIKGRPVDSSAVASSIICFGSIEFCDPNEMYRTDAFCCESSQRMTAASVSDGAISELEPSRTRGPMGHTGTLLPIVRRTMASPVGSGSRVGTLYRVC
ncbi:hypothetical protein D1007_00523 [Hordeum vulgare]|nr:hypothetical protein D1007_00523 [Hordeum vulgare]